MKYQVTEQMMQRAAIPMGYWACQVASVKDPVLKQKMQRMLTDTSQFVSTNCGVLLVGPTCVGKTAFACIVLRAAMSLGARVFYTRSFDLVSQWGKEFDPQHNSGQLLKEKFISSDLCVVDDLGLEPPGINYQNLCEYALRRRFENGRSTIITTNLTLKEMKASYSATFMSVIERVCAKVLVVSNSQWRNTPVEY